VPPKRHWRERIADILENIDRIQEFTRGVSFGEFKGDQAKILAVERCFEIIGEASRYVPDEIKARLPEVPWRDLREMRNVVAHVYFGVSHKIMWKAIQLDLPLMKPRLREFLEQEEAGGAGD
jgi:uncharacterized protein with HEPN domain